MSDGTIFVATDSIHGEFEGRPLYLHKGVTTARVGHPVLAAFGDHFVLLRPTFEVEADSKVGEGGGDSPPPPAAAPAPADVRAWAAEQHIEVSAKGKLPADVVDAYVAAHQEA